MSHFLTIVATPNGTDAEISRAMAPYHEFECTGRDDEFVKDIDELPEALELFKTYEVRRYRDPQGKLYEPYADRFYRDPTPEEVKKIGPVAGTGAGHGLSWTSKDWGDGRGYRTKINFIPEGWEEVKVAPKDCMTMLEWIEYYYSRSVITGTAAPDKQDEHKYGWCRVVRGKVTELVRRTNPSAKWDYWTAGGRWGSEAGYFALLSGGRSNSAMKNNIDFSAMQDKAGKEAEAQFNKVRLIVGKHFSTFVPFDKISAQHKDIEKARQAYHAQPACKALTAARDAARRAEKDAYASGNTQAAEAAAREASDLFWISLEDFMGLRETFVAKARAQAITPFAFVQEGKWAEKGKMGLWAIVTDEKEGWASIYAKLLKDVPATWHLTAIDCHI